jgi:hypothetical protein
MRTLSRRFQIASLDATMVLLVSSDIEVDKKTPVAALFNALTKVVTPQNVAG